jgi:16S rRNA (guanine527-N7)-methyltransferase
MSTVDSAGAKLNRLLAEADQPALAAEVSAHFEAYLELLLRWNARTNLTAVRDEDGILQRHFVESILCAQVVPRGVGTLLDLGSGAGFPGIPIALCRPEIAVTLAESQGKKAAFLREAARVLGISFSVHAARAESLACNFDCVTLRAVDRMDLAILAAASLVGPGGWLLPFATSGEAESLRKVAGQAGRDFRWADPIKLPGTDRILLLGQAS